MFARTAQALLIALLIDLLGGCAVLPQGVQRLPSQAIAASANTALGRIAAASQPQSGLSGFRLMPAGPYALGVRLEMIRRAQVSIDIQYYLIGHDDMGHYLLRELRNAAQRGVRVRLLLDDLYTVGMDEMLLGLAAHANVELRLFNPFAGIRYSTGTRWASGLASFHRLNRRMHNKLLIADGAMAVAGGRNLAAEYFMLHAQQNFIDLDTFVMGAMLPQMQGIFDRYWNSPYVYPVQAIASSALDAPALRAAFARGTDGLPVPSTKFITGADVLGYGPLADDFDDGRLGLVWAEGDAFADSPDKVLGGQDLDQLGSPTVRASLVAEFRKARQFVVLSSPYLVPGQEGMRLVHEGRSQGVKIEIVTNSLAATDEPVVHAGYRRYRAEMLRAGVQLYEVSPARIGTAPRLGPFGKSVGRFHAKTAVIDGKVLFIGSMNFDPRSERHNTEMGLLVRSEPLARELMRLAELVKNNATYRLEWNTAQSRIEWHVHGRAGEQVLVNEPDTSLWQRLLLNLVAPLAPETLL